jgi:hypothetical protein
MNTRLFAVAATVAPLVLGAVAPPAAASPTESALLKCRGSAPVEVTGFGRGQVLQVVGTNSVFVVTFAQLKDSGQVVFDNPGMTTSADVVRCTTTSPSGTSFIFQGFFTTGG